MPATISIGSVGDDVKPLQRVLARRLEWNPFGPITGNGRRAAIRAPSVFWVMSDDGAPARPSFTLHDADDVARSIDVLEGRLALRTGRHATSMGKEMASR
jgi:hypothetical protein